MKALVDDCVVFDAFPPGHIYDSKQDKFIPFMEGAQLTKRSTDIDLSKGEQQSAVVHHRNARSNFWVTDDSKLDSYPPPAIGKTVTPLEIRYSRPGFFGTLFWLHLAKKSSRNLCFLGFFFFFLSVLGFFGNICVCIK